MLDDDKKIHELDKGNALAIIAGQPSQLKQQFSIHLTGAPQNIVVAGMGGSALAAEFVNSWLADRLPVPLVIIRDYELPAFVDENTLLIASSYSGNTEETLSTFEDGQRKGARMVVMSSGGKLSELAGQHDLPFIEVPGGLQPRLAVLYGVKALSTLLESLGLLQGLTSELEAAADWVGTEMGDWTLGRPLEHNMAKQIAKKLRGYPAVVYGGPTLKLPAMKWKIDINENAKNVAFYNTLPEFNHNEFTGWLNPDEKQLRVVELQSSLDHPQVQKRFDVSNKLLAGHIPEPIIVEAEGETKLQQMLWTLLLGDFVSAYLAFLNGIDPTPVDLIEKLKEELA